MKNISKKLEKHYDYIPYLKGLCRQCYFHFNYLKNRKKRIRQVKEYQIRNKEKIKKWYNKTRKHRNIVRNKYYQKNSKKILKQQKNIMEKMLGWSLYNCRRRAKKLELSCNITKEFFMSLMEKQNKKCFYCNRSNIHLGLDRLNNKNGYTKNNVALACRDCNTIKSSILTEREMLKVARLILIPKYNANFPRK